MAWTLTPWQRHRHAVQEIAKIPGTELEYGKPRLGGTPVQAIVFGSVSDIERVAPKFQNVIGLKAIYVDVPFGEEELLDPIRATYPGYTFDFQFSGCILWPDDL